MKNLLISTGIILFFAFGAFQLVIGYMGIEDTIGTGWAIAALVCALAFRFTLPIVVGVYFGVVEVLEWHWLLGLLIAAPGILFMIPSIALVALEPIMSIFSRKKPIYADNSSKSHDVIDLDPIEVKDTDKS